jgi:TDG/mug DNA glycosylase family protein
MSSRTPQQPWRPTAAELRAAAGERVVDLIAPGLAVLFVGINPGLYSAAVGHHFARPGNRFWPALHASGFTPRRLSGFEERELLSLGCGITNIVARATAGADELTAGELVAGAATLKRKVVRYRPLALAFLGVGAYRTAFGVRDAKLGPQPEMMSESRVWVLPNPSGLNAHYTLPRLAEMFRTLRLAMDEGRASSRGRKA